eukprot:m51a1_g14037 hypothetical protein (459) ;mRNA; f:1166148-1168318
MSANLRACAARVNAAQVASIMGRVGAPPRIMGTHEAAKKREYHEKWTQLLTAELEAEKAISRARVEDWPISRLRSEGFALFNLEGQRKGFILGEPTAIFQDQSGRMPYNRFQQGDLVVVSRTSPLRDLGMEGVVVERGPEGILLSCKELPRDLNKGVWRLDKSANSSTYSRCVEALSVVTGLVSPDANLSKKQQHHEQGALVPPTPEITSFFIGDNRVPLAALAERPPPPFIKTIYDSAELPANFTKWRLNDSQKRAIMEIPKRRLSLIKGPPGTGKTSTAVRLLTLLSHYFRGKGITILATAFTNIGTDNLLEGLLANGVNALRIGAPVRVRPELREATFDQKVATHPMIGTLNKLREQGVHTIEELNKIETTIIQSVVYGAEVICSTCIGAGHPILNGLKGCQQLILIGDDNQLGPTIVSQDARTSSALQTSLFERLVKAGIDPFLLDVQYRMCDQ